MQYPCLQELGPTACGEGVMPHLAPRQYEGRLQEAREAHPGGTGGSAGTRPPIWSWNHWAESGQVMGVSIREDYIKAERSDTNSGRVGCEKYLLQGSPIGASGNQVTSRCNRETWCPPEQVQDLSPDTNVT